MARARQIEQDEDDYDDEDDYGDECDLNGDVEICDACNRALPKSKIEKHKTYHCKKQVAQCIYCQVKYPSGQILEHMDACKKISRDPNMLTCKYCNLRMPKEDM